MKRRFFSLVLLACISFSAIFAQETVDVAAEITGPAENTENEGALPRVYRDLSLGMPLSELKEALKNDFLFDYRETDVSFLPKTRQNLIDTAGSGYLSRAFFQLLEKQASQEADMQERNEQDGQTEQTEQTEQAEDGSFLFIMAFSLNTARLDYYSVYTHLAGRYGPPTKYTPKEAFWEDGQTRLSLERPLTVKYIDLEAFNEIFAATNADPKPEILMRNEFLEDF